VVAELRAGVAVLGLPALPGLLGRAILRRAGFGRAEHGLRAPVLGAFVLALAKPERALVADAFVVDLAVGAARGWIGPVIAIGFGSAREMMSRLFVGRLFVSRLFVGRLFVGRLFVGRLFVRRFFAERFFVTGLRLLRDEGHPVHVCRIVGERWAWDLGAATGDGGLVGSGIVFGMWIGDPAAPLRDHFFEHRIGTVRPVSGGRPGERAVADVVVPVGCPLSIIHRALLGRLP
jgi:hypothetical protein